MTESLLAQWEVEIGRVSAAVAADFPNVNPEDLSQELWVVVLDDFQGRPPTDYLLPEALLVVGRRYATQLRIELLQRSTQYDYRPSDVRQILETTWWYEDWFYTFVPEDAESLKRGTDELDLQSDITWGLRKLHITDRWIIGRAFYLKDDLSTEEEIRLAGAIERLTDRLNTHRGGLQ